MAFAGAKAVLDPQGVMNPGVLAGARAQRAADSSIAAASG